MTSAKGSLPLGIGLDPQSRKVIEQIVEKADVNEGLRGDPLDRGIKVRDLIDLGLAKALSRNAQRLVSGGNLQPTIEPPDLAIPPVPTGFEVSDGFAHIFLSWDNPQDLYKNHSYTIILRSTSANIASALEIGQVATGAMYADLDVRYGTTYYYWIRFVSTAGIFGPFNSSVGTPGKISEDPKELLERLEGKITKLELSTDLNEYVDGLASQYVLKIGQNGVVAGFGLAFTGPEYDPENPDHSIAIFNVDTFAITHPDTGEGSTLAFVVEGGKVVMDGASIKNATIKTAAIQDAAITTAKIVDASIITAKILDAAITTAKIQDASIVNAKIQNAAITSAKIADASITTAKIVDASIDTLKVAGEAIIARRFGQGSSGTIANSTTVTVLTMPSISLPAAISGIVIDMSCTVSTSTGNCNVFVELYRNGTMIGERHAGAINDMSICVSTKFYDPSPGTSPVYALKMRAGPNPGGGGGGAYFCGTPTMIIDAAKR